MKRIELSAPRLSVVRGGKTGIATELRRSRRVQSTGVSPEVKRACAAIEMAVTTYSIRRAEGASESELNEIIEALDKEILLVVEDAGARDNYRFLTNVILRSRGAAFRANG
jgi:hypothetical protein